MKRQADSKIHMEIPRVKKSEDNLEEGKKKKAGRCMPEESRRIINLTVFLPHPYFKFYLFVWF